MNTVSLTSNAVPNTGTFTFSFPVQRTTVMESNVVNPNYLRTFMLSQDQLRITQGNTQVAYKTSDLLNVAVSLYPALTWPPVFTTQPTNQATTNNNATSFSVVVSSEVAVNYQWYSSNDSGVNWVSLTNAGVFSNVTNNHVNISNTYGLGNTWYRVNANSVAGNANSTYGTLTVS
jgi:hypothetical protein